MEVLDLPMDILWEDNTSSHYTFICNQIDEILAIDIEQDLFSDNDLVDTDEDSFNDSEKWLNQPLPLTEISYQAPSNLYNFDNTTIIDVSNAPVITSLSNAPIQIISSKENQYSPNSSSGQISISEITTIADNIDSSQVCQQFYAPPVPVQNNYEDVALELQIVDELVRLRAQNLPNWADDENSLASDSTASSSPRSESSYNSSLGSAANDWVPNENQPMSPVSSESSGSSIGPIKRTKSTYKSGRMPTVEDRKYRKKEQNKNAANRYRQKKKAEIEIILEEEKGLEHRNHELTVKLNDVKREIKYIKSLMRELYRAKGILDWISSATAAKLFFITYSITIENEIYYFLF